MLNIASIIDFNALLETVLAGIEESKKENKPPTVLRLDTDFKNASSKISFAYQQYDHVNEIEKLEYTLYEEFDLNRIEGLNFGDAANVRAMIYNCIYDSDWKHQLPTTLLKYKGIPKDDLFLFHENRSLGETVVRLIRDETYGHLDESITYYRSQSKEALVAEFRDNWSEEYKQEVLNKIDVYQSFDENQIRFIKKLIINKLDSVAFSLMRAIDEKSCDGHEPIAVTISGIPGDEIPMWGNGNLSSDYLEWIERYSKFKNIGFLGKDKG